MSEYEMLLYIFELKNKRTLSRIDRYKYYTDWKIPDTPVNILNIN